MIEIPGVFLYLCATAIVPDLLVVEPCPGLALAASPSCQEDLQEEEGR